MRNKKTHIKTTPFLTTFPRLSFSPSFQTSLHTLKWHKGMGVTVSIHWFLASTPSFSHFSSTRTWVPLRLQSLQNTCSTMVFPQATIPIKQNLLQHGVCTGCSPSGISICSSMGSPQAAGESLLWCLQNLLLCCSTLFYSLLLYLSDIFCLFLNMFSQRHKLV